MKWDPSKYAQFGNHRDRPFVDLVSRIQAAEPKHVVDLGCGPGNLTATLAERWPTARVVGIDSSGEMLAKAAPLAGQFDGLEFMQGDIADWSPDADTDVVVTNAALQWVPGHQGMLRKWLTALKPGAWFAMQVPGNFTSPSHSLMRELAGSPRWRNQLDGVLRHDGAVGGPADYLEIMLDAGCSADAWETTYQQVLQGEDPVLEWVRGTGLRPVLAALSESDAAAFEQEYAAMLREAYPASSHGTVYPFRRIFAVARKNA
ncbi:trans-aconitate 2-methyltransferase [Paenarthrobacter nitroguajacolicus]|uniref:trans-aconitate 2-methyltransferase n=1 Tax=Paenarthrobacter nitroguajacolicus TaxID=211146 RepID=UPI00248CFBB2|nr:trans-aconitate 2-methyltransferase [Paenarthrobacter nitroguajacolicus]MDI2033843.1 putative trans-aconitate 2-methyltransferase [Paenarthrobacter nitroguajacolicus]